MTSVRGPLRRSTSFSSRSESSGSFSLSSLLRSSLKTRHLAPLQTLLNFTTILSPPCVGSFAARARKRLFKRRQGPTATPHGPWPALTEPTTVFVSVSITVTSFAPGRLGSAPPHAAYTFRPSRVIATPHGLCPV